MNRLFLVPLTFLAFFACDEPPTSDDTDVDDSDTDDMGDLDACAGEGALTLTIGSGGMVGFVGFSDGDSIDIAEASNGDYGVWVEAQTTGLNTASSVTAVYRVYIGGGSSDDYVSQLYLNCDDGPGWARSFLSLVSQYQSEVAAEGLDGDAVKVDVVMTDADGETASSSLDLFFNVSWLN
ncbi:MAG: hypothetical protein HN348_10940 [Proteobacteria bacterium]|jgi:hypothetical protein|nr:hypothetical protein [Pseudomonadota bacterium]